MIIANEAIKTREEERLIFWMRGLYSTFAVEAVRRRNARGWLTDGSLRGADLRWAFLRDAILNAAKYDSQTRWLEGFDLEAAGAFNIEL